MNNLLASYDSYATRDHNGATVIFGILFTLAVLGLLNYGVPILLYLLVAGLGAGVGWTANRLRCSAQSWLS
jgi:hypothetical protein